MTDEARMLRLLLILLVGGAIIFGAHLWIENTNQSENQQLHAVQYNPH